MAALCFVAVYAIAQLHTSVKQGRWSSLSVSDYVLLQSFFICRRPRPYRFSRRWMDRRDSRSSGPHLLCIALFSMLFFCLFLHPVDILCPHIFFLAFCFSQATLAMVRPREGHAALHSMVFLECKCRGRRKSSEIVCVCLCIMHEMKSAATHICISEIESVGPQLVGCLPKMGRGSFLMGSCTVGNNTMLNAIIKCN